MNSNLVRWTCLVLSGLPARRRWRASIAGILFGLALSCLCLAALPVRADGPAFDTVYSFGDADNTISVAVGDLNGDGVLDIVVGNHDQENLVYLNDGSGTFSSGTPFGDVDDGDRAAVGDLDGDGALDIVVGNYGQENLVYLNDGTGTFSLSSTLGSADNTNSVAVGDLDGDGDLDIVVGNNNQGSVVYLNNGEGTFSGSSFGSSDPTRSVVLGDLNGDRSLDIVVGNRYQENLVYLNDGTGGFHIGTVNCAAPPGNVYCFGDAADGTVGVAVGDLNGDGILDIIEGNNGIMAGEDNVVYLNGGAGSFSDNPFGGPDPTQCVAVGDLNGDGTLDLVVSNWGPAGADKQAYLNDGSGIFSSSSISFGGSEMTRSMAVADLNGDGSLDIVAGNSNQNLIYFNDGTAPFASGSSLGSPDWTYSVAVGDLDGDGALDIVVGNYDYDPDLIYLNEGTGTFSSGSPFNDIEDDTHSVAVGDLDGDGTLDIVLGNYGQENLVYLNEGAGTFPLSSTIGSADNTNSIAIGDLDGDGALDIVVGNRGQQNLVYLNEGAGTFPLSSTFGSADNTSSVAVGDLDGDGALDIVVGNGGQQNLVYLNDGTGTFSAGSPFGWSDVTTSVAVGDLNGDGALDIVVGNGGPYGGQQDLVYLNEGAGTFPSASSFGGADDTVSVAVGDIDGDGALDIVVGHGHDNPTHLYLNDGTGGFAASSPLDDAGIAHGLAVGDLNADGSLDIVVGSTSLSGAPNLVHLNRSRLPERLTNNPPYLAVTRPITTGNANYHSSPVILDSRIIPITYTLFDLDGDPVGWVEALYSMDGGGQWFEAKPKTGTSPTYTTNLPTSIPLPSYPLSSTPNLTITTIHSDTQVINSQASIADLNVYISATHTYVGDLSFALEHVDTSTSVTLIDRPGVPTSAYGCSGDDLNVILDDEADLPVEDECAASTPTIDGTFTPNSPLSAFDGETLGGTWRLTISDAYTDGDDGLLIEWRLWLTAPPPDEQVFEWDTFASGVFGQSDNVVFRLEAYPQPVRSGVTNTYHYVNSTPGPYQWPYASATTFPFRVRGTQVRVYSETVAPGSEVAGAMVYRLPKDQPTGGFPLAGGSGIPFRTDQHGYLQGRGEISLGDRLLALLPITWTESYTLYYTSGAPTGKGPETYTVTTPGVQTLVVSADNPLYLFNLDVSLEWDAHNDDLFLEKLEYDLLRAAEYLYDYTNGQAGLGEVYVFHDAENWGTAHARVYASNRLRPNATLGGYVAGTVTDTLVPTITYESGQIRMPATWNRYGDPGGSVGEDWPRTLAHEFGHYYLFLDDHYLGLDEEGQVISIYTCTHTAMTDPYRYSEYRDQADWLPACEDTMANHLTGRSDWATIETFYPELSGPDTRGYNAGPTLMPFNFTEISVFDPLTPTETIPDPTFYFLTEGGQRVQPAEGTRGYLLKDETWLVDVGEPVIDHILARGAKEDDRLCVFDTTNSRLGCEDIRTGDDQMILYTFPEWHPEIVVTPVTTNAISVTVQTADSLFLQGRIFSTDGPATEIFDFTETSSGTYETTMTSTNVLLLQGFVQIWVNETPPRREMITDYAIGASPGFTRGHGGFTRGHGGFTRGHGGFTRGHGGFTRGHGVPILSGDGQVTIYTPDPEIPDGEFLTIQAATGVPELPPGRVQIGQAYRIAATEGITNLDESSISFQYLGDAVPAGMEEDITIYYWDENEGEWHILATTLNLVDNFASARVEGSGLYALLAAFRIPLYAPGWNLFSYPMRTSQPVSAALVSIEGEYGIVYGYDATQSAWEAWDVYGVGVPEYVNDLEELVFGRGYWISVTRAITMYIGGTGGRSELSAASLPPQVPATYYGRVLGGIGPGETVRAWVDGNLCGQGQTMQEGGGVAYAINVLAEEGGLAGCGAAGRVVTFQVGSVMMHQTVAWDADRLWEVWLSESSMPFELYLPSVLRGD